VPFVLSWSVLNALLVDFFDVEGMAEMADRVLDAPQDYRHLGAAGVELVGQRYSLDVCLPRMLALYQDAAGA
jgi:glycosyltransferase involved in cell wall biosynthesis